MELHWSKFQLLQVSGVYELSAPVGDAIEPRYFMTYLGAAIYADGGLKCDLNRKLGMAWGDFCKLARLWKHTALPTERKIKILHGVVISRLLYGLSSAWLNVSEVRRLNGLYCRCLRVILRIRPAYISRVSNASVLHQARQTSLGRQLLEQQMVLYGKVARAPDDDVLRKLTFSPGSLQPVAERYVRKVGRPCNEWTKMLQRESWKMTPEPDQIVYDAERWRSTVREYCSRM